MSEPYVKGEHVRSLIDSNHHLSPLVVGDEGRVLDQVTDRLVAVQFEGDKFNGIPYSYMLIEHIERIDKASDNLDTGDVNS